MYRYRTGTFGQTVCRYGMVPVPYRTGPAPARRPVPVQWTLVHNMIDKWCFDFFWLFIKLCSKHRPALQNQHQLNKLSDDLKHLLIETTRYRRKPKKIKGKKAKRGILGTIWGCQAIPRVTTGPSCTNQRTKPGRALIRDLNHCLYSIASISTKSII